VVAQLVAQLVDQLGGRLANRLAERLANWLANQLTSHALGAHPKNNPGKSGVELGQLINWLIG
jgi:hypothetical protein